MPLKVFISIYLFLVAIPVLGKECKQLNPNGARVSEQLREQLCLEVGSYFAIEQRNRIEIYSQRMFSRGSNYHIFHHPNSTITHHLYTKDENEIYKTNYSFDSYGLRKSIPSQAKKKFLAFFGGSFTFGIGVRDEETLPSIINKDSNVYNAYNIGVGGSGIHHINVLINELKLKNIIKEEEGDALYIFHEDHINRAVGRGIWSRIFTEMPYFSYENKILKKEGSFKEDRKFITLFFAILNKFFKVDSIPLLWENDAELTCALIKKSEEDFNKIFPKSRMHVIFHPFYSVGNNKKINFLITCLKRLKISYKVFNPPKEKKEWRFKDGHPKKILNEYTANKILDWLSSNQQ